MTATLERPTAGTLRSHLLVNKLRKCASGIGFQIAEHTGASGIGFQMERAGACGTGFQMEARKVRRGSQVYEMAVHQADAKAAKEEAPRAVESVVPRSAASNGCCRGCSR